MSGFTPGMRSSTTPEWSTPRDLFDELDAEFHFDLDVASTDENALCEKHYTKDDDGLSNEWTGSVWCNPPYGREIGKWMRKAAESNWGGVTVCLVPARTDTAWWHEWIVGHATEVRFIRGRLKFGGSESGAPFPSAIVVYDKRPSRYWKVIA
ncbi:MAG: adenine methyltransferase [Eggerthellaceae bacterium]|nr:adenine methyltransferase [Eggerthellaceae bacterium]